MRAKQPAGKRLADREMRRAASQRREILEQVKSGGISLREGLWQLEAEIDKAWGKVIDVSCDGDSPSPPPRAENVPVAGAR